MSSSLWPHGLQHVRPLCPSLSPAVCSSSCPLSQWCLPTILSSVIPFSCLQYFPASGSFPKSQLFISGGQSIGASASASVLPMNIQGWFGGYTEMRLLLLLLLQLLLSCFSCVRLCVTHRWQHTRLHHPWDSPSKNTGVSCHFLLQCMKVKSESEVAQSCLTHSNPMDCSLPGSSIHGNFQARVLEWVAIAFSEWGH